MSNQCQNVMFHGFHISQILLVLYLYTYVKSMDYHALKCDGHISIDAYFEIHNVFQLSASYSWPYHNHQAIIERLTMITSICLYGIVTENVYNKEGQSGRNVSAVVMVSIIYHTPTKHMTFSD